MVSDYAGYFDYAAATPLDPEVLQVMLPYFSDQFYNPSADYSPAREVRRHVESARQEIALNIGARPAEIVFTAGGTEANNLAIRGVMEQFPGQKMIISTIEHESVSAVADCYDVRKCRVAEDGIVDIDGLVGLIDDDVVLVSIMLANNEIGTVQPIRQIGLELQAIRTDRLKRKVKTPLFFHTDAAQATNYLDLHVHRLGVDLMSVNGGKIYGPKQTGFLYVRGGIKLNPLILGGGQEAGVRSGTENVAGIVGLARALTRTIELKQAEISRLKGLQKLLFRKLHDEIPEAIINGSRKHRLPNNVHISIPGQDNERLMIQLDNAGFLVATGSACKASSGEPSAVLQALSLESDLIDGSLRITLGRYTTEQDIIGLAETLASLLARS